MTQEARPLVFLGTPIAAATVLQQLVKDGFDIRHVVTRPDAKRGRGGKTSPSPVKEVALANNLSVSHDLEWIKHNASTPMLGVVVAYGRIIPASVLDQMQMINVHFSLLPRWRGAAPVERAIIEGDATTGVCIMEVEPTLDTGAVYSRSETAISDTVTADGLTHQLALSGAQLLTETLRRGLGTPVPQEGEATYAAKISSEELRIDWKMTAVDIVRRVRSVRAYTTVDDTRIRIVEARVQSGSLTSGVVDEGCCVGTADAVVQLLRVQPEGKQVMDATAWLRGRVSRGVTTFQ
jgi:methionyl-tRNA formyltransferase